MLFREFSIANGHCKPIEVEVKKALDCSGYDQLSEVM